METGEFHDDLKAVMDEYVHKVYFVTKKFPHDEIYGVTSQFRRSALSVVLNYVEGFGRGQTQACVNFFQIAYGSLKESEYLVGFSRKEGYCDEKESEELRVLADRIGGMLWKTLERMKARLK